MATEVGCPKCRSTQLTANKKGFSGKKAVAGAFLTGGIGLLAGTIGSKNIRITCLACGFTFAPGEGKRLSDFSPSVTTSKDYDASTLDKIDQIILEACTNGGRITKLHAVRTCQDLKKLDLRDAKEYVENLMAKHGIEDKKSGCLTLVVTLIISSIALFSFLNY
jgi:hypothetical protein